MSELRKILLPLNGTPNGEAALATALILARRFGAHLAALHVRSDSREVAPLAGEGLSGAMVEEMMTAADREQARRSLAVREVFDRLVGAAGLEVRGGPPDPDPRTHDLAGPTASFRSITGREHELVAYAARLSDLTVVPHADSGEEVSSSEALHAVLFDSGRPVVIAPKLSPQQVGRRLCIAWNGTGESASAVLSILPWAKQAEAVQVLHSEDYQRRGPDAAALLDYLALHGVRATLQSFRAIDKEVGAGLLAACTKFGADMVSMGAYSHSRLRQLILGGVTRHVLENAQLTVLMAR
ncbi:universal stress protein [Lichenicoccus sp.]|uniref:universal stress protein n=1 Tax=Lichenicoccus sp. TaxID=2781899 RepID=UPI003D0E6BCD